MPQSRYIPGSEAAEGNIRPGGRGWWLQCGLDESLVKYMVKPHRTGPHAVGEVAWVVGCLPLLTTVGGLADFDLLRDHSFRGC